ncbi:MAG TPA: ABC transporter ATP-binding protein [Acidimicrobiales bacterium]|nr:ABC transporter ATP-binding protein [Acidimicrobiales bacterium]
MTAEQTTGAREASPIDAPGAAGSAATPAGGEDSDVKAPTPQAGTGRWGSLGQPVEASANFGASARRLLRRLDSGRLGLAAVIVLSVAGVTLSVLGPKLLGDATDVLIDGIVGDGGIDFDRLHRILGLVGGLYLGSAVLSWGQSFLLAGMVQRTMYQLRAEVEDKLNRLPLSYVDRNARGDLLSRVTNDIDNIAMSLQQTLSQFLTSVLMLVGTLAIMIVISPLLAVITLITVPLSIGTLKMVTGRSKPRFIAQWRHTGQLNGLVEESFTGHAIVKAFGRQREVEARFKAMNEDLYRASFGAQFISGSIQPVMMLLGNLNFVGIAVIGGLRVASGSMSLGTVQAFIQYSRQFTQPLTQVASMVNTFQSGVASAERVFELLDAEEQSEDSTDAALPVPARGRVAFEAVSFSYDPDRPLITDLSLVAEPGQTVAIVGPTGAGKTTLVNLLMRFYELDGGRITLDGADIAELPRAELRSNFGMVLQDTWLFGGTIRENIAYGNPSATEEQILAAARATYVDRFVHSLPEGYDTHIDDDESSVSAGEKQLLTIARAFLADPTILILDEATSSVDTRTEVLIQHAMAALRSQRTSFVIAHRLSTIRDADIILVMDGGRIVEQGHHTELLASGGAYATLYNAQFAAPAAEVA